MTNEPAIQARAAIDDAARALDTHGPDHPDTSAWLHEADAATGAAFDAGHQVQDLHPPPGASA